MKPPLWIWIVLHVVFALNEEQKKFIVEKHNVYRSQVDPSASDMMALRWSKSLEDLAKSYAAKCIWEHNENRGLRGENLFLMTGTGLDLELGLGDWYQEHKFYNFTSLECEDGKMCSHYTQMVWADTEKVGCGHHFCEKIKGYDVPKVHFLVCNYEPPGNYIGMKLYKEGSSCANCPAQSVCNGSLCGCRNAQFTDCFPHVQTFAIFSWSHLADTWYCYWRWKKIIHLAAREDGWTIIHVPS
uniref:Peptidase inhibitor 16 n=1 Tax=Leptobrachium leishanense TaxID=445787 RepID=A0A8C5PMB5_9ANUR